MERALVILCGGNSTRMGSDKALLPFGDYCLIEYLVQKFKPSFSKIYLSVKKKGDYAHLNLPVTEIPDIYANAGPMSGVFSGLSMIDEERAFFMSVDTPFLEPETGVALLDALGDADICTIQGKAAFMEHITAAYSKSCTTTIGKCLLLHQFTFQTLREKCTTKYLFEKEVNAYVSTPIDFQFYNLDTRANYYHALRMLSGIRHPDSSHALLEYFHDNVDLFTHTIPTLSFVCKPGTIVTPFLEQLTALLKREGLSVLFLTQEEQNLILHNQNLLPSLENLAALFAGSNLLLMEYAGNQTYPDLPNKVEILKKDWSDEPLSNEEDLLAVVADFPYEPDIDLPVFDMNKPKAFLRFIHEQLNIF